MTQSLKGGEGPHLAHSLECGEHIHWTDFWEKMSSMVVVKNLTAIPITITKGVKVALVVAANVVPPVKLTPHTLEKLDEIQGIQQNKMMVGQGKILLFQQLDLSGLDKWPGWKPGSCLNPVSWVSQHLSPRTWRVRLYGLSKTWY